MYRNHDPKLNLIAYSTVAGVTLILYSLKQIKKKTAIRNTAKQLLSSASAGSVEVEAVAWPLRAIDTSMEGRKIVYRHMTIQKLVQRDKRSKWETVWKKSSPEPFLIFDHTGFAIVDPNNDDVSVCEGLTQFEYSPKKLTSTQLKSFDDFYDHSVGGFNTETNTGFIATLFSIGTKFRILERSIAIGTPLFIQGFLSPEDHFRYVFLKEEFKIFKERADKLLSNKNYRLSMMDKDKNGSVDSKELYDGFQAALKNSVKKEFSITDYKTEGTPHEKLYGTIAHHPNQDLLIMECFEEQILNSSPVYLNWLCLYLGAGLVSLAIIVFMIFLK